MHARTNGPGRLAYFELGPVRTGIPGFWLAAGLGLSVAIVAMMLKREQLTIAFHTESVAVYSLIAALATSIRYRFRSPRAQWQRISRDLAEYVGIFMLTSLLGVIASYPAAAESAGFVDPSLAHIDQLLHFNWVGWYTTVSAHPTLQKLGSAAYVSIYVTPAILLGYFAYAHRRADAHIFLASFWLAAVITLVMFVELPARGPLAFLWHGPIPYMPTSALYQAQLIPALRHHEIHGIELGSLRGLVCAPSFHSTSAILYIAAAWPIARLRWPILLLNAAMLLSTPVEGTHYLTDMIVGVVVAIAALATISIVADLYVRRRRHQPMSSAPSA